MATDIWVSIGSSKWIVAWRPQVITWTNVDLQSIGFWGTQPRTVSQDVLKISIYKFQHYTSLSHISQGANELKFIVAIRILSHDGDFECDAGFMMIRMIVL